MHKRKTLLEILYILLAVCICIACIRLHQSTPFTQEVLSTDPPVTQLDLSGTPLDSLDIFDAYPQLQYLNVSDTGLTVQQYKIIREKYPDCTIVWDIPIQGAFYPQDTTRLILSGLTDDEVILLDELPQLTHVFAWGCRDYAQLLQLQQRHPDCAVFYNVHSPAGIFNCRDTDISVPGDNPEALLQVLPYLPRLQDVTLLEPLAEAGHLAALTAQFPHISFHWESKFHDIPIGTDTVELNLSGISVTVEEIDAILPYMPNLEYLDMSGCGISNEDMDSLNRRHESVKIVWTVSIGSYLRVKTDITSFMPAKHYVEVFTQDIYNLRYCTDLECIDLGHMKISNCEFAAYMPKLKYLMLADTRITDLTPLSGLKELVYLELFMTPVSDYSPLLSLTSLEDLNLYFTYGESDVLKQMTWLKNLWWRPVEASDEEIAALIASLPDTHVECSYASSTGNGWRELPNYYAQRDIFGLEYMKG